MNAQPVLKRYNVIKITIVSALFAPWFFEILNMLTGLALVKQGVMERWPIFIYMATPFVAGFIIQRLEYVRPDILTRLFLMLCWIFAFFVSSLFWESLLRETPQGIQSVVMLVVLPTAITSVCFFLGLSSRGINA